MKSRQHRFPRDLTQWRSACLRLFQFRVGSQQYLVPAVPPRCRAFRRSRTTLCRTRVPVASVVHDASKPSGPVRITVTQAPRRSAMATSAAERSAEYMPPPTRSVDLRQSETALSRSEPMSVPGAVVQVAKAGSPCPESAGMMSNPAVAAAARPPRVTARRRRLALALALADSWLTPNLLVEAVETGWELRMRFRSACARVGSGGELCPARSIEPRSVSRFCSLFISLTPFQVMPPKCREHGEGGGRGGAARPVWRGSISDGKPRVRFRGLWLPGARPGSQRPRAPGLLDGLQKEAPRPYLNRCDYRPDQHERC